MRYLAIFSGQSQASWEETVLIDEEVASSSVNRPQMTALETVQVLRSPSKSTDGEDNRTGALSVSGRRRSRGRLPRKRLADDRDYAPWTASEFSSSYGSPEATRILAGGVVDIARSGRGAGVASARGQLSKGVVGRVGCRD